MIFAIEARFNLVAKKENPDLSALCYILFRFLVPGYYLTNCTLTHLFEQVVSVLLECEVGGAAVIVEAVVHIFQLEDLPDLQGQVLKGNGDAGTVRGIRGVGTVRIDLNINHGFSKGRNCKAPFFINSSSPT